MINLILKLLHILIYEADDKKNFHYHYTHLILKIFAIRLLISLTQPH